MNLDFFSMLQEQNAKEREEVKTEDSKNLNASEQKQDSQGNSSKKDKTTTGAKKTSKKEASKKKEEPKKAKNTYKYPFAIYSEGQILETNHIFEDGKEYTEEEITTAMLNHKHYEFSGEIEYKFFEEDNVLMATLKQFKKG